MQIRKRLVVPLLNLLLRSSLAQQLLSLALACEKRLCLELVWMAHQDQRIRRQWMRAITSRHGLDPTDLRAITRQIVRGARIDIANTQRMKQIITQYGWPGIKLVGPRGTEAAALLIQHADHDPAFQQHCLVLLQGAVKQGDAFATSVAYLTDRIHVAQGLPQVYGTQFHGQATPLPIEDETCVDERRAAVGLPSLAEYSAEMKRIYSNFPSPEINLIAMQLALRELPPEYAVGIQRMVDELRHWLESNRNSH